MAMATITSYLLVYMLAVVHCSSREEVYFVKPTEDGDCDGQQPCDTLSGYVEQGTVFQKSNVSVTLEFYPGCHKLHRNLEVTHSGNLSFCGVSGPAPLPQLHCHGNTLNFTNVLELNLDSITLLNCAITANEACKIEIYGCMFQKSHVTAVCASLFCVNGSIFDSNVGTVSALSISEVSSVQIAGTNFTNNVCLNGNGGAVYIQNVQLVSLVNTRFINNSAYQGSCGDGCGMGGALAIDGLDSPEVDNIITHVILEGFVVFVKNYAEVAAGGIAMFAVRVDINGGDECVFRHNSVYEVGAAAAMFVKSNVSINSCYFYSNINKGDIFGGALYVRESSLLLVEGVFRQNIIYSGSGSAIRIDYCTQVATIVDCKFQNNSVLTHGSGGAVGILYSTQLQIVNSSFIENIVFNGSAGAIAIDSSEHLLIVGNTFRSNIATYGNGGAIVVASCNDFTITNSTLENNLAVNGSGGAALLIQSSNVAFKDTLVKGNEAREVDGGGLEFINCEVIFWGETYLINNTGEQGGGIIARFSTIRFKGNLFVTENIAQSLPGGGMCLMDSVIEFDGEVTNFERCRAYGSNGGGLYIENSQVGFIGRILEFNQNYAVLGGGGLVCYNVTLMVSGEWIQFVNNSVGSEGYGGALMTASEKAPVESSRILISGNVLFKNNSAAMGGALCISTSLFLGGSIVAVNNTARKDGGWLFSSPIKITISGDLLLVEHNSASEDGGALSVYETILYFKTECMIWKNNKATSGGALNLKISTAYFFSHKSHFMSNSARFGGGIYLKSYSTIVMTVEAMLFLSHNTATLGGAMYVDDFSISNTKSCTTFGLNCFFDITMDPFISLLFSENYAVQSGSDLYGGMLDRCSVSSLPNEKHSYRFPGVQLWFLLANSTRSAISSDPSRVCFCNQTAPTCDSVHPSLTVFRGQQSKVSVAVLDQLKNFAPFLVIRAQFSNGILGEGEYIQTLPEQCGKLTFRFFSSNETEVLTLYSDKAPCRDINISKLEIPIKFLPCPLGFQLSEDKTKCVCHKPLLVYTTVCNIDSQSILRDGKFWFSYENKSLIVYPHCPFDYCIQETESIAAADIDKQCAYNRSGTLCGACETNLSLSLGSSRCQPCHSPSYIWLTLLFALAGVFLVAFLSVFRFTVSVGTLNGLIFFSNVVVINKSLMFPSGSTSNPLLVLLAWLNLDLGIETCYYDGMDMYGRTWLQFVFPLYVWSMVGLIIIVSHYSTYAAKLFGRNPVAVLATLFLLSYTKLLRTIITVFSVGFVQYPETGKRRAVWLYDANVGFLQGKHIPLFVIALLVLLFLFLPFTMVLFFGQWLRKYSGKRCLHWARSPVFTSIMDAYHAPYKNKHRYWTGLLLLVRCALFLTFSFNVLGEPSLNLLAVITTAIFLILLEAFFKVYKNRLLNILELFFLTHIGILSIILQPVSLSELNKGKVNTVSLAIVFLVFCGILIYHSYLQIKDTTFCKKIQQKRQNLITKNHVTEQEEDNLINEPTRSVVDLSDSNFLEPLLEDSVHHN